MATPSVAMIPSGYKDGTLYNVLPNNAAGDFDVTRGSLATRVNESGLIEPVGTLGADVVLNGDFEGIGADQVLNGDFSQEGVEQVTNGDFATDSDWIKGSGWSISGGTANCDGTQTTNSNLKSQTFVVGSNPTLKLTFDVTNYSAGTLAAGITGTGQADITNINANGTYSVIVVSITGNRLVDFVADADFIGSIDNVSVREVGQNWLFAGGSEITEQGARINNTITGVNAYIKQSNSNFTIGKSFVLEYDVVATNGTTLVIEQTSSIALNTSTVGNNRKIYFQWDIASTGFVIKRLTAGTDVTITNISVKEVGQNWTFGTGWSIGDNIIYFNNPTGTELSQQLSTTTGKYKIKFDLDLTSGNCQTSFASPGTSTIESFTTSGTKEVIIETTSNYSKFRFVGLGNSDFSITNISVIEITDDTNLPRINFEGFSYQDALGSEEVVNGGFNTDLSGWNNSNNYWQWSSQGAYFPLTTTHNPLSQVITSDASAVLKFTFTLTIVQGTANVYYQDLNNASVSQQFTQSGTYTIYTTPVKANTSINFSRYGGINTEFYIDNVYVKEYLGQEVVPDSGCGSWLFEPQSTNLFNNSEDFSSGSWVKTDCSVVSNFGVSPSGQNNASKITFTTTNTSARVQYNLGGLTTGNTYTQSYYIKSLGADITLRIGTSASAVGEFTDIIATSEWQRFEFTGIASGTTEFPRVQNITGALGVEILVWGAQFEEQTYATSYIPTEGSTNTRNQDLCYNGGSLASINSTEGVLYAEIAALSDDLTTRVISLSDGTANERVVMQYYNATNRIRCFIKSGGSFYATVDKVVSDEKDFHKIAYKYKSGETKLFVDGTLIVTSTNTFSIIGLDVLQFSNGTAGDNPFFGKTKCLAVWKEALSDSELQSLTTI